MHTKVIALASVASGNPCITADLNITDFPLKTPFILDKYNSHRSDILLASHLMLLLFVLL
jgi:hypothetical protein